MGSGGIGQLAIVNLDRQPPPGFVDRAGSGGQIEHESREDQRCAVLAEAAVEEVVS